MSESATGTGTLPGSSVQTIGGVLLALGFVVSLLAFASGDFITGGMVLLYIPVGYLLFSIGRGRDLV
ncbi:MAG: hypothetical protein U5K70_05025 [Halodesulfurarchaeum sp.]|nr:hypothetical protein [Halodesulfurarchaeum sp.]